MERLHVMPRPALSKAEAAELLGIAQQTVNKLIKKGKLRAIQIATGTIRILFQDFEDFLCAHQTIPPTGVPPIQFRVQEQRQEFQSEIAIEQALAASRLHNQQLKDLSGKNE